MTITKDSAKLYKFLKDESRRDDMQTLEDLFTQKIRYCYTHSSKSVYLDLNIIHDYFRVKRPVFANDCRKFDDL